jgi:hypothetical protein
VTGREASLDRRVVDGDELAVLVREGACTAPRCEPRLVCSGCPVRERCRRWATAHDEWGVWSGQMFRHDRAVGDPELRDAARRLFAEGKDHKQVAALLDISTQRAVGLCVAWRRQQRRRAGQGASRAHSRVVG